MQIHVVNPGDSLFSIANTYGTTVNDLASVNELNIADPLVVGQTLVIPIMGQFHFVAPGESLFTIAQQYNTTPEELASVNNIPIDQQLTIGLRLYIPQQPRRDITSLAYFEPLGDTVSPTLINATEKAAPYLTFLAIFSYAVNRDGTLKAPPLNNVRQIAENNQAALTMVVTNLEEGAFSSELAHIIMTVQAVQNNLLDQVVNVATSGGYRDVHFDFEFIPQGDREAYNQFLRKARQRLSQAGLMMSTALAPKVSATQQGLLYEAHDYATHGEIVDFVVLMTYEWGYSAGPPLPVSPLNEVRRVVEYAVTEIPNNKILLGQNLYGYDWTLPFVEGGPLARALSPQQAIALAREQNVAIEFDQTAQAPFFTYIDEAGREHIVWFEDARSIQGKFNLIKEFDLLGIAYWKLGLAFPQNWWLLQDNFNITKL